MTDHYDADSARILLRSASGKHPSGLANGSEVGRNYMFHNSKAVIALDKKPNLTVFRKTLGLNDFYLAGDGREWPFGNAAEASALYPGLTIMANAIRVGEHLLERMA